MLRKLRQWIESVLASGSMPTPRPQLKANYESSVPGLYVIGDLAGAPVVKLAMSQGFEVIEHIAGKADARASSPDTYDLLVVGAGAAGLNAALAAQDKGLRVVVLEKGIIANTIEDFPEGKWVYAEPDSVPPKGKLWLDGARKEDLLKRWHQIVKENRLDVRTEEGVTGIEKQRDGSFVVSSERGKFRARRVILASGQRGIARKLDVPGEEQEHIYHRLYSPRQYKQEDILVVGGGNSAVEAALVLAEQNRVRLSYRGTEFTRVFKENRRKLDAAVAERRIELVLNSTVQEFGARTATLRVNRGGREEILTVPCDHAFVLIGAEVPKDFLKSLGIKLENEWSGSLLRALTLTFSTLVGLWFLGGQAADLAGIPFASVPRPAGALLATASLGGLLISGFRGDRYSWLGLSFLVWYTIYGVKSPGAGKEFWPFRGWGFSLFSFLGRPATFWYTVLYTVLVTAFGIEAMYRWGIRRRDRFQIWRYISLLGFQLVFFFLIPEFLFHWAVRYQWVGERLASDPTFADHAWRSYGIVYAWPLFFYTFFYDPHIVWVVWGVLLTFVSIPLLVLFHGKRYCSWICGCGGLAETFGDRWRHLAPKGPPSLRWEVMNLLVLVFAALVTVGMLIRSAWTFLWTPVDLGMKIYQLYVDIWLVGILPVTLYPFLGGKIWCRYWCPLAKWMELLGALYTRAGVARFQILANDKCIACAECTRNCQVGIDVMGYALKQQAIDNGNSSCIGCGICITVCPMDVLSFGKAPTASRGLVQIAASKPS